VIFKRLSDIDFAAISRLESIEELTIEHSEGHPLGLSTVGVDKLHRLVNLKKLTVQGPHYHCNPLNGLKLAVNENLTEIKATFACSSNEFVRDLARCLPNLKKLHVIEASFYMPYTDCWKYFENLEHLHVCYYSVKLRFRSDLDDGRVLEKLKFLYLIQEYFCLVQETAEILVHDFPNLEELHISDVSLMPYESIKILLRGLKNLKVLYICDNFEHKDSNVLINYVKEFGRNLKLFHISCIKLNEKIVRRELSDRKGLKISSIFLKITI
jgi:hypothetical protein